jgi:hypothetical protein
VRQATLYAATTSCSTSGRTVWRIHVEVAAIGLSRSIWFAETGGPPSTCDRPALADGGHHDVAIAVPSARPRSHDIPDGTGDVVTRADGTRRGDHLPAGVSV